MNKPISYIMQGDNIVLVLDNESHNVSRESHANYNKILEAIRQGDWDNIKDLLDVGKSLTNYSQGKLSITNGDLSWDGRSFHNALAKRIIQMYEQGFDVSPMTAFMENLMLNPSYRAVEELYGFLEKNTLPITPDGCFMAYKRVKETNDGNLVDHYTNTFSNNVGDTVTMPRNEVNDDQDQTCSAGLHFCSLDYLTGSGYASNGTIVLVKINPADVVSIPTDYNDQKGRCCAYSVEAIHGKNDREEAFDAPVVSYNEEQQLSLNLDEEYTVEFGKDKEVMFGMSNLDIDDDDEQTESIFKPV